MASGIGVVCAAVGRRVGDSCGEVVCGDSGAAPRVLAGNGQALARLLVPGSEELRLRSPAGLPDEIDIAAGRPKRAMTGEREGGVTGEVRGGVIVSVAGAEVA